MYESSTSKRLRTVKRTPPPKQTPEAGDDLAPLKLAESSEGSTQPVDDGTAGESEPGSAGSQADELASGEGSTGGFETMLGKLVVRRGLATAEEVELCHALRQESVQNERPQTLADLLVARQFLTLRQLARVKREFEAKKSTEHIPGYEIKKKIGAGAMATVFLGRQLSLDRLVAIKVLPRKLSASPNFIERFYKEGRAAAQLNHPNIVNAYDVGRAGDHHYFVMEYVDGQTLHDLIRKVKRIKEDEAIRIVRQVTNALRHAHRRGFIHRDIKPKNIMLATGGSVKLADLGLAREMSDREAAEAEAGRAYGTPYYISPEQIRGEVTIGPAADIYGLGATFYHMVTGRVPFEGKNPSAVMHKHLKTELTPPDHINPKLSAGCAQVIEMMMAKDPRDRYHSEADLIHDLKLVAQGAPPHFAHRSLAMTDVAQASSGATVVPAGGKIRRAKRGPLDSTAFIIVLIGMIVSLLVNAVVLVKLFS